MAQPWYDREPPQSIIPTWVTKKLEARPQVKTPGRPKIESKMHKAMEQGRKAEAAVGDAIFNLMQAKKDMEEKVAHFVSLNWLGSDCYFPDAIRPIKLAITIIKFIKKIQDYINEIMDIINAMLEVIGLLSTLLAQLQAFLQNLLNQIATLLNEICNLRLPDLPSFAIKFGKFKFPGFSFAKLGNFSFKLSFDKNFAFGNCKLRKPNQINTLGLPPEIKIGDSLVISQVADASGPFGVPDSPIPGVGPTGIINDPGLLDPDNIPKLRDTSLYPDTAPIFTPDYSPHDDLDGSLPDPDSILNDFKLPAESYENNVLSLVADETGAPPLFTDLNVTADTTLFLAPDPKTGLKLDPFDALPQDEKDSILSDLGDLDAIGGWKEPSSGSSTGTGADSGWGDGSAAPLGLGGLGLTKAALITLYRAAKAYCQAHVTLEVLEDCGDPGFKPHVTSAWLRYMNRARTARKGVWVESYQHVWDTYIAPSIPDLSLPVRWNKDLTTGETHRGADSKFAATMTALRHEKPEVYRQVMWMLSYLEASMLGYRRSTRWDAYALPKGKDATVDAMVKAHVTGFSLNQLDYTPYQIPLTPALRIVLDQDGKAEYPSSIQCPGQLEARVREAILIGKRNIEANKTWRTSLVQFSHGYTAYGETQSIDRYSQFWREWSNNFAEMLALPEPLRSFVFGYTLAINSFCNPLAADKTDPNDKGEIYKRLKRDVMLRDWDTHKQVFTWKPGQPSLPAPVVQLVQVEPSLVEVATNPDGSPLLDDQGNPIDYLLKQVNAAGVPLGDEVFGNGWSSGRFNPHEFLDRPDIKALSPNVQLRMMECHQAAQDVMDIKKAQEEDMGASIAAIEGEIVAGLGTLEAFKGVIEAQLSAATAAMASYPLAPVPIVIPGGTYQVSGGSGGTITIPDKTSPTPREIPVPPATAVPPPEAMAKMNTPVRVVTQKLGDGKVCELYDDAISCQGGSADYTWVVGGLPPGITADPFGSTVALKGRPTAAGVFNVTAKVTESGGTTDTKALKITIQDTPPLVLTTKKLAKGKLGQRYADALSATGGKAPYTWDHLPPPTLHAGLTLNSQTGEISGKPTESGIKAITFRVRDTCGKVHTRKIVLTILE